MKSGLEQARENISSACPHFGKEDDRYTYLAYPSRWNYCFNSKPPEIPKLDHQQDYCLTLNHQECPVFKMQESGAFPVEYRFRRRAGKFGNWKWIVPTVIVILVLIVIFTVPGLGISQWFHSGPAEPTMTAVSEVEGFITPTVLSETPTPSLELATNTVEPSETPVVETKMANPEMHGLDEPIGITNRFVIHRIQEGESLGNLAAQYQTTLQAIQDVNYFLPDPVWIDWLVIIPVETTDVIGLPKFEAQIVVNGDVTIEDFALNQDLDPELLKFYNGMEDGYLLSSGEWLLIPHVNQ